jgi:HEAT repeat protein
MALNGSDREVQEAAVWALGRIGGREARRALEACYESEDEALSQAAAEALDEMDLLGSSLIPLYDDFDEDEYE